jgi:uncharacterized protein YxeA
MEGKHIQKFINNKYKYKFWIIIIIIILLILLITIFILNKYTKTNANISNLKENPLKESNLKERFKDVDISIDANAYNSNSYEKNKTLLYGALFLDNLDEQIKNLTDPRIQYDSKRIDIIKYSDVLL